jgi:protein-disulfide isomerase
MYPHAESAAETVEFAGAHGKFWEMHDALFENQDRLGGPLYLELTQELGLSPAELRQALEEGKYKNRVRADFSSGVRSGVNGTPTFFINGKRHDGPFDYESLVLAIAEATGGQRKPLSA